MDTIRIEFFKNVKEGKDGRWRFCQLSAMKAKLGAVAKAWWLWGLDCVNILLPPSGFP